MQRYEKVTETTLYEVLKDKKDRHPFDVGPFFTIRYSLFISSLERYRAVAHTACGRDGR